MPAAEELVIALPHATLAARRWGAASSPPLLALHGWLDNAGSFDALAPLLAARWQVVALDFAGHGRSSHLAPGTWYHYVDYFDELRAVFDHFGWSRADLLGHSLGGTLASLFAALYPERWQHYVEFIPSEERGAMVDAYWRRLESGDEAVRLAAARAWGRWEGGSTTLVHDPDEAGAFDEPLLAISVALAEAHYFRHACFLEPGQLLRDIDCIRHIPATIVQGRYDIICPVKSAYELARAWPEADFRVVLAGHSAADPAITDALVTATDALADRFGMKPPPQSR